MTAIFPITITAADPKLEYFRLSCYPRQRMRYDIGNRNPMFMNVFSSKNVTCYYADGSSCGN